MYLFTVYDKNIKPTHLILVSKQDVIDTTQFLINHGANVNSKTNQGQTVLTYASRDGFSETVKILVENGADVNSKTNNGFTALMVSFTIKKAESFTLRRKSIRQFAQLLVQFPKMNVVTLVKSTLEIRSLKLSKTYL